MRLRTWHVGGLRQPRLPRGAAPGGRGAELARVTCCDFHRSWTRQACRGLPHHFYSDDTQLTQAALWQGLGVAYLPCFMGEADPLLQRHRDPDPAHDLGLWVLLHPDLKRTARVLTFRDHMVGEIEAQRGLFEGRGRDRKSGSESNIH